MTTIKGLRAIRYAEGTDLSLVTAPPYDVISAEMKKELQARHQTNIIHLTLGPKLEDEGEDRYALAGQIFRRWLDNGVLFEEEQESLFLYRFDPVEDSPSAGIIAALELERLGEKSIFPHEKTMSGPKADRLALTKQTQANLEPIWLVSARPLNMVSQIQEGVKDDEPLADVLDAESVRHRLWRVPEDLEGAVIDATSKVKLVIADGHHRYETLVAYRDQQRTEHAAGSWDFTLAMIQDPEDLGPALRPIHRIVRGLDQDELSKRLSLSPFAGNVADLAAEVANAGPGTIGVVGPVGSFTTSTDAELDTLWLADLLTELGSEPAYEHHVSEVENAQLGGAHAFVLAPIDIKMVTSRAMSGHVMPPKTTLFWPKPLSGLLLFRLNP